MIATYSYLAKTPHKLLEYAFNTERQLSGGSCLMRVNHLGVRFTLDRVLYLRHKRVSCSALIVELFK